MSVPENILATLSLEQRFHLEALLLARAARSKEVATIPRRKFSDSYPLSFAHQRIWFIQQLEPTNAAYNISLAVRLTGPLNLPVLQQCLDEIVRRHEALRTTFHMVEGTPVQRIAAGGRVALPVEDLSGIPEAIGEKVREPLTSEVRRPFDLAQDLLVRARLLRLGETDHLLQLTLHHIACDGWSLGILSRELGGLYEAFSAGRPSPFPELPLQYADFAVWQRGCLQGEVLERHLAYWRKQLEGAPEVLELPTDRPRPAVKSFRGARQALVLDLPFVQALGELSRREGVTLFMTLLAAFQALLSRYTGREDIVVGTSVANRNRPELEGLIGFFINMLVLRTDLRGNPRFRELLGRVREVCLGAYAHQDLPFERLVQELHPERNLAGDPLFQVALVLQNAPPPVIEVPGGLTVQLQEVAHETALRDLTLTMWDGPQGLAGVFEYSTDLFDAATILRMRDHFRTLLEGIVADPDRPLSDLPVLSEAERRQLLVEWNDTRAAYPQAAFLHECFEAQVKRTPAATAVVFEGRELTYAELNQRANQLAHYLKERGVGPEVLVGISLERSVEMVVALLGVLKAGGAYVPLNPAGPKERSKVLLEDAGVPILLTEERLAKSLADFSGRVVYLDAEAEVIGQQSPDNPVSGVAPQNAAYVIFTSGSTGQPKGVVVIEHRQIANYVFAVRDCLDLSGGTYALVQPLTVDSSQTSLFLPLITGGCLHLVSEDRALNPNALADYTSQHSIDCLKIAPSHLAALLTADHPERVLPKRWLILGGEASQREWVDRLQGLAPGCTIFNHYGPTETTVGVLTYRVVRRTTEDRSALVPMGRPVPNTQAYVLDRHLRPVPIGVPGELYIGGQCLARGYLHRPELTAERFIPHPFSEEPGARLYRTGDLARRLPDDNLLFLGRIDQQIKVRGFRIEPAEIEAVLRQHPAVREALVVAREDSPEDRYLVAYLVGNEGPAPTWSELRRFLQTKLPDFMIPSAFLVLDAFPRTPHGKVDRKALPVPGPWRLEREGALVAPRTPLEEKLARIWSEVLRVERVGIHDNFFDLGGHSLLAMQIVARLRQRLSVELPVRTLFEAPTVAGLTERIEAAGPTAPKSPAPLLRPAPHDAEQPLSFAQERLWFLDQLDPGRATYHVPFAQRLRGPLNVAALERSLKEVLRRHEVLRTTFQVTEERSVQVLAAEAEFQLAVTDLRLVPDPEREAEALRFAGEEARRPFHLVRDLMLRAHLLQLGEADHLLLLTLHHIAFDGWSLGILCRDLATLYESFAAGRPASLAELPLQYADFAVRQREWLQGQVLEQQLAYWRKQLAGAPGVLDLPTDRPRPVVRSFRGGLQTLVLDPNLTQALGELSRREGVTLFMTLLAAFQALLSRYSGQEDIVVGVPVAGRSSSESEGLIGLFVNTLAMRTDLSGDPTFRELLNRVREVALDAYAHQDVPFEKLVDELQPERTLSHNPLFQVMFTAKVSPQARLELPGLMAEPVAIGNDTAKFDLTLAMTKEGDHWQASLAYSADLFEPATAARMLGHWEKLLKGIAADPGRRISQLPLLSEPERRQLLGKWNETATDFSRDRCIHELFETQAEKDPEGLAVVFEGRQLTYRQLNVQANRLAHHLRGLGVGAETRVGLCVERSLEMVVGLLGILKAGGAFVPLDPTYPRERLAFLLEDSQVPVVLTQTHLLPSLSNRPAQVICLDADPGPASRQNTANPVGTVTPENLAYVLYTSGSTGTPKGVMIEHRSLTNYLCWVNDTLVADRVDGVPALTPLTFDASLKQLLAPFLSGREIRLLSGTLPAQPEALLQALAGRSNVGLNCVPSLWEALLDTLESASSSQAPLPIHNLRCLFLGGERVTRTLIERSRAVLPHLEVWNLYGPTEGTANATAARLQPGEEIAIGRPIANTEVYVLDRRGQPVPVGVAGELFIGGVGLARGYSNRPEATAERFLAHPFSKEPGARLYKTGDLVRWRPDGNLEFLGRLDHQVKLRGYRIEPGEIEAVLCRHPQVRQAVVLVREDRPGDKRLAAYLVPRDGPGPAPGELRRYLGQKLPEYMVPSAFVSLDRLPLTPHGKVDRQALPVPRDDRPSLERAYVAPRTPGEEVLAGIWGAVLGRDQVGVHDNFFELGGHSLLAIQLVARLRQRLSIELPVRTLFEAPTVAGLAEKIEAAGPTGPKPPAPPLGPAPRDAERPLSFAQERLWFLDQLDPGRATYHVPFARRLRGPLDVAALERSLKEIVRRHEVLRTTFQITEGRPVQVLAAEANFQLAVTDLRLVPDPEREAEAHRVAGEEARRPFHLARDLMLRANLFQLGEADHLLLLTLHHIAFDGWSLGILCRELAALYAAYSAGGPSPLPELPLQYADFAVWQRQWLQGERLERQLAYWRRQLEGAPALLELPTDHPRPAVQSHQGARCTVMLDPELTRALKELSRREGGTLFMTLLAAFQVVLSRYSGQEDIVVGAPVAGRTHSELEGLIGFFVNTLALRTDLSGNPTFRELLGRVRQVALEAYTHQDLPFEKLVEELQPRRTLGHAPLLQVMFQFRSFPEEALELAGLQTEPFEVDLRLAPFDLAFDLSETPGGLACCVAYDRDLFEAETIVRLLRHFQTLLAGVTADPGRRVRELPLWTEEERQQVLIGWNRTEAGYPREACIPELFEAQVERTPEATAVVFATQRLTYRELNQRANQLAHYLRERAVGPETRVGLCVERSLEMVVGLLGILKAGGAYVPLDPTHPPERLAFLLKDSGSSILLTQSPLLARWPRPSALVVCPDAEGEFIARQSTANLAGTVSPNALAYVTYTSGSTGTPKGVAVPHRGVVRLLFGGDYARLDSSQTLLHHSPLAFDASTFEIWGALLHGAQCVLFPERLPTPQDLGRVLAEFQGSTLWLTSALFNTLIDEAPGVLAGVRQLLIGGEALSVGHVRRALEALTETRIINGYGPTEGTTFTCCYPIPRTLNESLMAVPIGRPIANTQVYVLDGHLQPVPIGVPGELYNGGAGLARGYLNRPDLTAERFIAHPFSDEPGARLYKTGDRVRWRPDGNLEFLGRLDRQVKIRGFRIEPGEIEAALAHHPQVREAVVLGREDRSGDKSLAAYVVPRDGQRPAPDELRRFLGQKLPEYMVPSAFVFLDCLPLTPHGKVNRQSLPAPGEDHPGLGRPYVAPRTLAEELLAGIWAAVLGRDRVGVHDNFFELGGHSLLAMRVVAQIRRQVNADVSLRVFFERPTIEGLALHLLELQARASSPQGIEELLAELESISEESAEKQLLEARDRDARNHSPEEGKAAALTPSDFRCPNAPSEWFGKRHCNLVIMINDEFESASFEKIAGLVGEIDPAITAVVASDRPGLDLSLPARPTLIFSPALIRYRPPLPSRVFCGFPLSKSEEYTALEKAGFPVPRWALLSEGVTPDLSAFDEYVVRKPDYGGRGAEVKVMPKNRVRWKPITTSAMGTSLSAIIQEFIYTGRRPVTYRVNTLFGKVLYSMRNEASADRPELAGPGDLPSLVRKNGFSIVGSGQGGRFEFNYDEEIIRLGESAHAAFPDIPLLGFDIVREVPSGKLYVLEANAIGYVWTFDSLQVANWGFCLEEQFDGLRKAAYVLAEKTQELAR